MVNTKNSRPVMHKYKTKHVNYKTYVPVNNNKISDLIMRLFTTVCILSTQAKQIHGIHPARFSASRVDPPSSLQFVTQNSVSVARGS